MGNLLAPLAQRRHVDANDAEPVVQVFAELALRDALLEIRVGRRDDPDVHALRARLAKRHDFLQLEKPQQLRLDVDREVADFVEEERASRRGAHKAWLVGHRAREASTPVAEELAIGQFPSRRRAVVRQKHRGAAVRTDVDGARDELLARAALARDEHGEIVAPQTLNLFDETRHRGTGREKPRQERLERSIQGDGRRTHGTVPRRAERESLPRDGSDHAKTPHHRVTDRTRRRDEREARPFDVAPERLEENRSATVALAVHRRARHRPGGL